VVEKKTLDLVHLRASQINGCSVCVDMGFRFKMADETIGPLFAVAAWKHAPYFTDAERAALALTEAVTRLSDLSDPVPDEIWKAAARHYDESGLASLVLSIATTKPGIVSTLPSGKSPANGPNRTKQENGGKNRLLQADVLECSPVGQSNGSMCDLPSIEVDPERNVNGQEMLRS
jgi:hypothetical protein